MGGGKDCYCTTPTSTRPLVPRPSLGLESGTYQPQHHPRGIVTSQHLASAIFRHQASVTTKVPRRATGSWRLRVLQIATCLLQTGSFQPLLVSRATDISLRLLQHRATGSFLPLHRLLVNVICRHPHQRHLADRVTLTCAVIWVTITTTDCHTLHTTPITHITSTIHTTITNVLCPPRHTTAHLTTMPTWHLHQTGTITDVALRQATTALRQILPTSSLQLEVQETDLQRILRQLPVQAAEELPVL